MCVVSNIGDHYRDRDGWPWRPAIPTVPIDPTIPKPFKDIWEDHVKNAQQVEIDDLKKRVAELEELLRKGAEFDAANGQPNCEMDEKVEALKKIAEALGVKLKWPKAKKRPEQRS